MELTEKLSPKHSWPWIVAIWQGLKHSLPYPVKEKANLCEMLRWGDDMKVTFRKKFWCKVCTDRSAGTFDCSNNYDFPVTKPVSSWVPQCLRCWHLIPAVKPRHGKCGIEEIIKISDEKENLQMEPKGNCRARKQMSSFKRLFISQLCCIFEPVVVNVKSVSFDFKCSDPSLFTNSF